MTRCFTRMRAWYVSLVVFSLCACTDLFNRTVCRRRSPCLIRYATLDGLSRHRSYVPTFSLNAGTFMLGQILFLNKIDLFAEKLPHSPLGDYFPDYTGGNNYDAACDYLLHRFVALNQNAATKQIYAHYTCATDTQQIKCASTSQTSFTYD